jgi:hypothetical protein
MENRDPHGHPLAPSAIDVDGLNMLRTISQLVRGINALGVNSREIAGEQLNI